MKRSLITKVIAGGFFTIAAFVSYAATVTTTSTSFEVDTTVKLIPESANWSEGSITLWFTDGGVAGSEESYVVYFRDAAVQSEDGWEEIPYSESERMWHRDAAGKLTFTDPEFATRLNGIPPIEYLVVDSVSVAPNGEPVSASCITRKKHGIFVGVGEYDERDYPRLTKLDEAPKRAEQFATLSISKGGMIGGSNGDAYLLQNGTAKYENVCWAFDEVSKKTKDRPGDICILYFDTHGGVTPNSTTTLSLCLYNKPPQNEDPRRYGYHEVLLARHIKSLDPDEKGVAVFCVIGACHSGAAIDSSGEMSCSASEQWCQHENLNKNNIAFLTAATTDSIATDVFERYLLDWGWSGRHAYPASSDKPLTARMLAEYTKRNYDEVHSDFVLKGETVKRTATIDNKELLSKIYLSKGDTRPTGNIPSATSITDVTKGTIAHAINVNVQFGTGGGTYIIFKKCGENELYEICTNITRTGSIITDLDVGQSSCDNPYTYCLKTYNGFGVARLSNKDTGWRKCIVAVFDANGGIFNATATRPQETTRKLPISTLVSIYDPAIPIPVKDDGYGFVGWSTSATQKQLVSQVGGDGDGRITYYAYWKPIAHSLSPWDDITSHTTPLTFSQTYTFTSYLQLPDDGGAAGTMTVKTQKEKGGVAAATVTIQTAGGKKQTIKGTISTADGTGQGALAGLTFTASGVTGTFNGHVVDGAVDASKSKDAATVALLNKFKGKSYVMALEPESTTGANADKVNGVAGFSIVFSAKGKAKVSGTMPDGMKVSASSQLIVGSEWCCLPVVYSKTGNSLAFLLWFDREGNFDSVSGMTAWKGKGFEVKWNEDVAVSKVGNLSGASYFNLAERPTKIGGMSIVKWILPINVKITPNGTKWDVPESSSVKMDRSGALVYGANPSALKLTYKAKTGTFSGRVTFYSDIGGRLKKIRAMVNGIVVDGIGYGMATVKKQGTWPVVIGPNKIEVTFETAGVVLPSNFVGEYTGYIADFSRATGNPKWPMERGTLAMSIGADGETQVVIDSILGKVLFSAKGWDYYSKDYGYADVVLIGNGGEQLTLSVRSDLEWYHTELEGSVVGGIFGSTQRTIYGARNRFTDSWGAEVKDGVKAFLAKQTGNHRISVSSINYGGGYPYNWVFGIANEGENAPLTLTIDDDGTATVTGTLNGRKIEGVTRILFWSAEYYARANFYLQLDATTECLLSFALYSCYEPWQNIGGEGWMRNRR